MYGTFCGSNHCSTSTVLRRVTLMQPAVPRVEAALDMEEDRASLVLLDRAHVVFDHGGIAVYLVVAAKVFEIVGPGRLLRHLVVKRIFGIADPIVLFAHDDERPRQIDIALVSERESHRIGSAGRSAVSFSFLAVRRDAGRPTFERSG